MVLVAAKPTQATTLPGPRPTPSLMGTLLMTWLSSILAVKMPHSVVGADNGLGNLGLAYIEASGQPSCCITNALLAVMAVIHVAGAYLGFRGLAVPRGIGAYTSIYESLYYISLSALMPFISPIWLTIGNNDAHYPPNKILVKKGVMLLVLDEVRHSGGRE